MSGGWLSLTSVDYQAELEGWGTFPSPVHSGVRCVLAKLPIGSAWNHCRMAVKKRKVCDGARPAPRHIHSPGGRDGG